MAVLLAVRFLAELGMLFALAWGGRAIAGPPWSILLTISLPVLAGVVWGLWVAPKARRRLPDPARLGVEVALFTAAAVVLQQPEPTTGTLLGAAAMWAAFLVSLRARGHETAA